MQKQRRCRGTGSIFKRGDIFVWQHTTIDGKTKTQTLRNADGTPIADKKQARLYVERLLAQEHEATTEARSLRSKAEVVTKLATIKGMLERCEVNVSALESAWLSSPKHTEGNAVAKTTAIRHFVQWLRGANPSCATLADITADMALVYMSDYWRSGITPRTYNVRLNQLQIVFRAFRAADNPFYGIAKKQELSESREPFTAAQLQAIWQKLEDDEYHMLHKDEMRCVYITALYTGLRCGDVCCLPWSAVDLAQGTIAIVPRKTSHSSRSKVVIPLAPPLLTALTELSVCRGDDDHVFPMVAQRYRSNKDGIYKDTSRLLAASGIIPTEAKGQHRARSVVRYGFHSFRHTTATMLVNQGVNSIVVKELLGHTTVAMTAHYSHVSLATKRNALAKLLTADNPQSLKLTFADISADRLEKLSAWLDNTLTDAQKHALQAILA